VGHLDQHTLGQSKFEVERHDLIRATLQRHATPQGLNLGAG
jgi:hypothetical protein